MFHSRNSAILTREQFQTRGAMNRFLTGLKLPQPIFLMLGCIAVSACEKPKLLTVNSADLELQVIIPVSAVQVGKKISYTIKVKNIGENNATNVKVANPIPQTASYVSSTPNKGACQIEAGILTCTIDSLAINTSAEIMLTLNANAIGTLTTTANVSANETDPVINNNSANINLSVQAAPPPPTPGTIKLPPTGKISWDWQIGASGDSNVTVPSGAVLIDVDGFNISKSKITSLKAAGVYTVCYIDAGSYEDGRPDSSLYPAYLKIYYDSAWGEWFLDVKDVFRPIQPAGTQLVNNKWVDANGAPLAGLPTAGALGPLLKARFQMCADKGFDSLEPDNLQNDENAGGKITTQEQIDFNGWVADTAHSVGLAAFQKNGPDKILLKDRTGKMMVEKFDAILNEECQQYSECNPLAEYVKRGKLALNTEYSGNVELYALEFLGDQFHHERFGLEGWQYEWLQTTSLQLKSSNSSLILELARF